jgi:hypothetical protein
MPAHLSIFEKEIGEHYQKTPTAVYHSFQQYSLVGFNGPFSLHSMHSFIDLMIQTRQEYTRCSIVFWCYWLRLRARCVAEVHCWGSCLRSPRNCATKQIYCLSPYTILSTGCQTKDLRAAKLRGLCKCDPWSVLIALVPTNLVVIFRLPDLTQFVHICVHTVSSLYWFIMTPIWVVELT